MRLNKFDLLAIEYIDCLLVYFLAVAECEKDTLIFIKRSDNENSINKRHY
mgnify:CR=1 FL=1